MKVQSLSLPRRGEVWELACRRWRGEGRREVGRCSGTPVGSWQYRGCWNISHVIRRKAAVMGFAQREDFSISIFRRGGVSTGNRGWLGRDSLHGSLQM